MNTFEHLKLLATLKLTRTFYNYLNISNFEFNNLVQFLEKDLSFNQILIQDWKNFGNIQKIYLESVKF